jgi:8-oxo-dGTP diphosphatase
MIERNKAVPAVYLLLLKHDEILLMQRAGSGYYDGWYSLPAGHVEYRESPIHALIRECKEEVAIELTREELVFGTLLYREAHDETGDRADLFFVSREGEKYQPRIMEPDKCTDLRWFKLDDLPENMVQNVRFAVHKALSGETYAELDFATLDAYEREYRKSL